MEKPSPVFLIVLGGIGTALLSPLSVNGFPVILLSIPLGIAAAKWKDVETGLVVGVGSALLSGALVSTIGWWNIAILGISSVAGVFVYSSISAKSETLFSPVFSSFVGALLFELLFDIYQGQGVVLRSEDFLGTLPDAGIRVIVTVALTILIAGWEWSDRKK